MQAITGVDIGLIFRTLKSGDHSKCACKVSYHSYEFCYLNHVNIFESTIYSSKGMVMVIPKVVMVKQRQTSDPDICVYSISIKQA